MSSKPQKQLPTNKLDYLDKWNVSGSNSYNDAEEQKRSAQFAKDRRYVDFQQLFAKLEEASVRERIKMIEDEGAVETLRFCMAEYPQTFKKIVSLFKGKEDSLKNAMKVDSLPVVTGAEENLSKFKKINSCINDAKWGFSLDQNDQLYINASIDSHYENIYTHSKRFRNLLSAEMSLNFDEGISNQEIEQVVAAIYGRMIHKPDRCNLYRRVARIEDSIFVDSGRDDWLIYKITADDWCLKKMKSHRFTREENFRPYSCDEKTPRASWDDLFSVLGISDPQAQGLIKIWLAVALIPNMARPGMVFNGPPGSGKTTLGSFLRQLVDPVDSPIERLPGKMKSLELTLHQNQIPAFDNLSGISQEVSNTLCLAITGSRFDNCKLYTDSDTVSRFIQKPWILTGISIPGTAADFLSRVFIVDLGLISPEKRRDEGRIKSDLEKLIPGLQALIFDCISAGLKNLENVRKIGFQRLADAHRYSLAMSDVLKMSEAQIDAIWVSNKESQDSETAGGDILSELIPQFLKNSNGEWEGSYAELHKEMHELFTPEHKPYKTQWPQAANTLSRRINTLEETLLALGIVLEKKKTSTSKKIKLSFVTGNDDIHENDDTQENTVIDNILELQADSYSDDNADSLGKVISLHKNK